MLDSRANFRPLQCAKKVSFSFGSSFKRFELSRNPDGQSPSIRIGRSLIGTPLTSGILLVELAGHDATLYVSSEHRHPCSCTLRLCWKSPPDPLRKQNTSTSSTLFERTESPFALFPLSLFCHCTGQLCTMCHKSGSPYSCCC